MKAVVAVPPVCDFYFTAHRFSALGARILRNLLTESGFIVSYYNFPRYSGKSPEIGLPSGLDYLNEHLVPGETGRLSFFTRYRRYGPSLDECADIICRESPDICFLSCFAFSYSSQLFDLASGIKKNLRDIQIVVGGAGPSAYPAYFIRNNHIDYVITGEAEVSIGPFIAAVFEKSINKEDVPNLFWKDNGNIASSNIRQTTKSGEFSVVISKSNETKSSITLSTSVSRGCPKKCGFCSNHLTHGSAFRIASTETVRQSIDDFLNSAGPDIGDKKLFVNFEDDNLLLDAEHFFRLMEVFRNSFPTASFLAENGLDYSLLSPSLVDRLAEAGMAKFNLSIASCDPGILSTEKRSLDLDHYRLIAASVARRNIPCITYFICGLPGETRESAANTMSFLFTQTTAVGISLFYAVPGISGFEDTRIFDEIPPCCCNGSSAYPWNGSLSTKTLVTAFRLCRYINLVKQEKKSGLECRLGELMRTERRLYTQVRTREGIAVVPVENCDEELAGIFFEKIGVG